MKKILITFLFFISLKGFTQGTPCPWDDGLHRYYVKLITDVIPTPDFDKTDFINHLITNSNPPTTELDFLNGSISSVTMSFPSSMSDSLRKVVTIACDYDSMDTYLSVYTDSIEYVEFQCQPILGVENFNLKNNIKIYPNPITNNSIIKIDQIANLKKLKIYDITGKKLYSLSIEKLSLINLNIFQLENGIYVFKFISDNRTISKKIISK